MRRWDLETVLGSSCAQCPQSGDSDIGGSLSKVFCSNKFKVRRKSKVRSVPWQSAGQVNLKEFRSVMFASLRRAQVKCTEILGRSFAARWVQGRAAQMFRCGIAFER